MGAKSLSKIGSTLGTPLLTDECTTNMLRVSFARILVEVDITQELKKDIIIKVSEGRKLVQHVEYEWKPMFCEKCHKVGYKCGDTKPKMQWRPQPKPPEEEKQLYPRLYQRGIAVERKLKRTMENGLRSKVVAKTKVNK